MEFLTLGSGAAVSFEAAQAYEGSLKQLQAEYERRRGAIRDRSAIHPAGIDLLGGRLIVRSAA
jgi:hypothetical protein